MFATSPTPRARRPRQGVPRPLAALAAMGALAVLATSCAGAAGSDPSPAPRLPDPAADTAALTEQDVNAWLDGVVPSYLQEGQMAGAAVSVVADGELLTSRGYGYSDVEAQEPVDPDQTLFRVGSVSKVFTATAVMQLVEAGELDLDTDVDEYLDFEVERSFDQDLTLRHLLSHTGGFEERIADAMLPEGEEVDLREVLVEDPPEQDIEPGTTPGYSNYGIAMAGYIVEITSGVPFAEYLDENVLAPAGMDSSSFQQPLPEELESRLSEGYDTEEGPPVEFETVAESPAGSLTAPVTDMGEFMRVHMEASGGAGVLEPETISQMHEPALGSESLGGLAGGNTHMGLGFFLEEHSGDRIISHGGDTGVFHSHMQIHPEENAGIFITMNTTGGAERLDGVLRVALTEGFTERYFPGAQDDDEQVESTASEHAAMLEGSYLPTRAIRSNPFSALYSVDETQITATEDGTIVMTSPETRRLTEYMEVEPWVWREVDGHRTLAADVVDGQVRAIGSTASFFMPVSGAAQASVLIPVFGASVLVFLVAFVSWLVGPFVRWRLSLPPRNKAGRWARVLTRVAMVATVLAFAGWGFAVFQGANFAPASFPMLRAFQVLQGVGLLGVIPAAVVVYDNLRRKESWEHRIGSVLVLLALLGSGWIAVMFGMVTGSVSY